MSRRSRGKGPKLELRLHLSPPRVSTSTDIDIDMNSPYRSPTASTPTSTSPPSSCLTWETAEHRNYQHHYSYFNNNSSSNNSSNNNNNSSGNNTNNNATYLSSPEATSMVLVGCPCCLMYVMLCEDDPKCPRCKSTVLLDFLNDPNNINSNKRKNRNK